LARSLDRDNADIVIKVRPASEFGHVFQNGGAQLFGMKVFVVKEGRIKSRTSKFIPLGGTNFIEPVGEQGDAIGVIKRRARCWIGC
jgi:hypothetical protein